MSSKLTSTGKIRFAFCAVVLMCVLPCLAQNSTSALVLTVDDAVQRAAESNVNIQKMKLTLEQLKKTKNTSWNSASPSVLVQADMKFPYLDDTTDFSLSIVGSLTVQLTPAIYANIKTAITNYENGVLTFEQTVRTVELNVRQLFYRLLSLQEKIRVLEQNLDTARRQYEQNERRFRNGQTSELEMLQSRVNYEQLKPALESTQISYANQFATFKQLIGVDLKHDVELSGSISDSAQFGKIHIEYNVNNTPTVQSAEKQVEIAKNGLLSGRLAGYAPSIRGSFSYGQSYLKGEGTIPTMNKWNDKSTSAFSLVVSLPLDTYFPWSDGGRKLSMAKKEVKTAELALVDTRTTVTVKIENLLAQIHQAQSQLEARHSTVALAQRSYDMTLQAYNQGARDLLSLQAAADNLLSAQETLVSQEYELIVAVLNLENELGLPFGTIGK